MIISDYHIHTAHSFDSEETLEAQVSAAITCGLKELCITDHHDPGYPDGTFFLDIPPYYTHVKQVQEQFRSQIHIACGIELGLLPSAKEEILQAAAHRPWDFIIGSSHVVDGYDPYYSDCGYWSGRSLKQSILRYYESILENLSTFDCFDVYGHIDYIYRYIPSALASDAPDPRDFDDIIDVILRRLIALGKGIECNTAGFKYGLGHPNPDFPVLKRYFELGGEILTIGSDSHKKEHVAFAYKELPELLKACGARYYTVFHNRIPTMLPL